MVKKDGMVSTNIRDIPEALYEQIKASAAANRRSVNNEMVVLLQRAIARGEEPRLERALEDIRNHPDASRGIVSIASAALGMD